MEAGPERASLLQIGFVALHEAKHEVGYLEELHFISPVLSSIAVARGQHRLGFFLANVLLAALVAFYATAMIRDGNVNVVSVTSGFGGVAMLVVNLFYCFFVFLDEKGAYAKSVDEMGITQYALCMLKGMEILGKAQTRMAQEKGKTVDKNSSYDVLRSKMISETHYEVFFVHFLPGASIGLSAAAASIARYNAKGDMLMTSLSIGASGGMLVTALILAHVIMLIRLNQKLAKFEVRRVEADIRTVAPGLIHRITPRFKTLLHECHMIGNTASGLFMLMIPIILINTIQFVSGVFATSMGGSQIHTDYETGLEVEASVCVPAWTFVACLCPMISVLVFIWEFGNLNLAIERDVDQDIVEMNIRLTYSDQHVPNWLLQQMLCLERLDGRAFSMPFNVIPSVEMSRKLLGTLGTALVILGPYVLSIRQHLTMELLCEKGEVFEVN
jgi:hypothetical protein